MKTTYAIALVSLIAACEAKPGPDQELAASIASGLTAACPAGVDPGDEKARNDCADKLTNLAVLRDAMREPFIWGGQVPDKGYALNTKTNKFNARVWRRMYLSTFMFGTNYSIEQAGDTTVMHIPVTFRGAMSTGAYPYPFWHSEKKWNAYNYATTIHFVIQNGMVIGALRGMEQDTTRPKVAHSWDGLWHWKQDGVDMPYVSFYDYLLSKGNPHMRELNDAYRAMELRMRQNACQACHAPDDQGKSDQLEFFVLPNQALAGRHDLVTQLQDNLMPPEDNTLHLPAGIADPAERQALLRLARDFERIGDQALAWEGENKAQY